MTGSMRVNAARNNAKIEFAYNARAAGRIRDMPPVHAVLTTLQSAGRLEGAMAKPERKKFGIEVMQGDKKIKITKQQALLWQHMAELGIECVFEFRFCLERKFRFDLYCERLRMGFEVNGNFQGLHGRRYSGSDNEKFNLAQMHGYRCLVFTNKEVEKGEAKEFMKMWQGS